MLDTRSNRTTAYPGVPVYRSPWYTHWWLWVALGVLLALLLLAGWIGIRATQAKNELDAAASRIETLKSQINAQDTAGATETIRQLRSHVQNAVSISTDPLWRTAEVVPFIGPNLSAVRLVSASAQEALGPAVSPLVQAAGALSLDSLKPAGGVIDVHPLAAVLPQVQAASTQTHEALKTADQVDANATFASVHTAVDQFRAKLSSLDSELASMARGIAAAPGILGYHGPRAYLLLFQDNGEAMPAGGTIGSMAILTIDNGHIALSDQSSASERDFPPFGAPVVPLAQDVAATWPAGLGTNVQDLTETPRFPLTYQIAAAMWQQARGIHIDGVASVDTVFLGKLLGVTGPVTLPDGTRLDSSNAVPQLLGDLYRTHDQQSVDLIHEQAAQAVFTKLFQGNVDAKRLFATVQAGAQDHRVLVWSSNTDEQKIIAGSPYDGDPPRSTSSTDAFGVYLRDETPSKMGFYLRQQVDLAGAQCSPGARRSVLLTVKLTNSAPTNAADVLPPYVTGDGGTGTPRGAVKLSTTVYAPHGYSVVGITVDGVPQPGVTGTDGSFVVGQARTVVAPATTSVITMQLTAGHTDDRTLTAEVTPLVTSSTVTTSPLDCAVLTKK